ncbi:MAG TPA: lantibiotic dehydratase family protein, partial [Thermoanaerobaculia bacterium]
MSAARDFVASDLVVLRTPLLPFEDIEAWMDGAPDRATLRARLAAIVARPEVREALFVASPDLVDSLEYWERDPDSKKGQRAELGLVRYLMRMATRPTPFGLFSGCTAGAIGAQTRLALSARDAYRRHSRLDMDYLFALCETLTRDRDLRAEIRFRTNASLYETGGRLRYAEARVAGRLRTYHLVAVDTFDALTTTLDRAKNGATLEELAASLVESDPEAEITFDEASAFIHDLVDNQLLLPELALPVTGEESTPGLLRQLSSVRAMRNATSQLARTSASLDALDARGIGCDTNAYLAMARELEPLGVPVEMSRLFQIDLFKPAQEVALSDAVIGEILRGVELLHRPVVQRRHDPMLEDFRRAFRDRYGEGCEVSLLAALDEETGIGFDRSGLAGADASPLLAGLAFGGRATPSISWMPADATLIRLLSDCIAAGRQEVELTEEDWNYLENRERPPLPDAFHAVVTLAAESAEAIERGDYRIYLQNATGPSGARMLGRFCHADAQIRDGVIAHLAAEEALAPDAIFAEIVHLPAGRMGNILARPVLRQYEIPFLGSSGAPADRQIPVSDLMVTVIADRIRLRSLTHDREVIPRLTTA